MASTEDLATAESGAHDAEAALRAAAFVVAEAERGVLSVSGSERASWLNGVVTCDATTVTPGRATFGLLLSKQGKIQTDFHLLADGDRFLLAAAPGTTELVRSELERMLVMEDVELADVSSDLALLSLHGPRSVALARDEAARVGGVSAELDRTGFGGAVLVVPRRALDDVSRSLGAAGAYVARAGDWPSVRVAHGVGAFGQDYGPADNPHEAALERRAIAWNKGCYLGQEAVFMQDARGKVKRRLVVLRVASPVAVAESATVERRSGERVGDVTSAASGSRAGEQFALAKVLVPDFEPGTELVVGGSPAWVVARAFDAGPPPDAPKPGQTV